MNQDEIKILITGDFAPRLRVTEAIERGDYASIFGDLIDEIRSADIAITNLESPLCDTPSPILKTGPNLISPTKSIEALRYAGFCMVSLANNHLMDQGVAGLTSTIETCTKAGIDTIGAGMNIQEAQRIKSVECKGKKIAFINCCENEWSTTFGDDPGANPLNEVNVFYQIQEAKSKADYTILIIHGGHETYGLPSPRMKRLYHWFINLGVDAVIGHHTHCYSGKEEYKGKPIVYSLGNFVFDHPQWRDNFWTIGCACSISISNNSLNISLIPFHQCDSSMGIRKLNVDEKMSFGQLDNEKTKIIQNDERLKMEYEKFVETQKTQYNTFLEPTANRWLLGLIRRNIIRSLWNKRKRLYLLDLCRCEAHRDIIIKILEDERK